MAEWFQTLEIADSSGRPTGKWRMTRRADDPPSDPIGLCEHEHETAAAARACPTARSRLPDYMVEEDWRREV